MVPGATSIKMAQLFKKKSVKFQWGQIVPGALKPLFSFLKGGAYPMPFFNMINRYIFTMLRCGRSKMGVVHKEWTRKQIKKRGTSNEYKN